MKTEMYDEIKEFIFELIANIKPDITLNEFTPIGSLGLDEIDFSMIAIECEEKYQIIVDEKIIVTKFFIKEFIEHIIDLINQKGQAFYYIKENNS